MLEICLSPRFKFTLHLRTAQAQVSECGGGSFFEIRKDRGQQHSEEGLSAREMCSPASHCLPSAKGKISACLPNVLEPVQEEGQWCENIYGKARRGEGGKEAA